LEAGRFALEVFESQPGKCSRFDLQRRQAAICTADDLNSGQKVRQSRHQMGVQRTPTAHHQRRCVCGMA
jgi:hypothetical protein